MPTINNFPEDVITEHVNWHTAAPGNGGRIISTLSPGSGEEFLVWHKGFIERFRVWVDSLATNRKPDAAAIAPWTEIPATLKMSMFFWNTARAAQEQQLQDMDNFSSLDDLGKFLEDGLHGWLHFAAANHFSEPTLMQFESPRSTYFWQLHGLIDHWRAQFVENGNRRPWDRLRARFLDDMQVAQLPRPRPGWPRPPWPPQPWPPVPPVPPWDTVARPQVANPRLHQMELTDQEMRLVTVMREAGG